MDMGLKDMDGIDEASGRTSEATEDDVDDDDDDDASETSSAVQKKEKKDKKKEKKVKRKRVYGTSPLFSFIPTSTFPCETLTH